MSTKKYSFINELGNEITAKVTTYTDDRDEPVQIKLIGPDSTMENNVTTKEAEELAKLIRLALRHIDSSVDESYKDGVMENDMSDAENLLFGEPVAKVKSYLSLRGQFMTHAKACAVLNIDPAIFVPGAKEAREFVKANRFI